MSTQTAKSMHPDVGKVGELHAEDYTLQVTVNIVDAREVWHRLQYLIEPLTDSFWRAFREH